MSSTIETVVQPESAEILKGQQNLAAFIQNYYVNEENPDKRSIDIRDDGQNGCSNVIYFDKAFTDEHIKMVAKDQLIIGIIDNPVLDWIEVMPWEHALWITGIEHALQIHCGPIAMSNGEESEVFAIQFPVAANFSNKARHLYEGKIVRFRQDPDSGALKILGQVKREFPVIDIS